MNPEKMAKKIELLRIKLGDLYDLGADDETMEELISSSLQLLDYVEAEYEKTIDELDWYRNGGPNEL